MKVLLITPSPPEYLGGLALFCKDLALNLEKNDIQVDILTSTLSKKGPITTRIGKNINVFKQKVYLFPDNENMLKIKNPFFLLMNFLRKHAHKYDLIHVHSYIYFSTFQTFLYKILFNKNIPVILHLHGGIQTEDYKSTSTIENILLLFKKFVFDIFVGKYVIDKATALISVSRDDLLAINQVFRIKRKKHNYFLPNVIDADKFKNQNLEKKYIGFIGRLTKIKGIDLFLELIDNINKENKDQRFLIIGEGPYLSDVKDAVNKYPIKFIERVKHEDIMKYYNKCSIFVQTSRAEGLPTCILEALSCELAVVASNVGGTNELIMDKKTGYLFENGNIKEAIKKIKEINNNNEYQMLGKNGRKLILEKYSWHSIIKKIIKIYEKILLE